MDVSLYFIVSLLSGESCRPHGGPIVMGVVMVNTILEMVSQ